MQWCFVSRVTRHASRFFRTIKNTKPDHPEFLQGIAKRGSHNAQTIGHASSEIDGGCLREVTGGAGDLGNLKTGITDLGHHLVVENKVIGISMVVDRREHLP